MSPRGGAAICLTHRDVKLDRRGGRGPEGLVRPTRELPRAAVERSLLGLAPGGVCRAEPVARSAG